VSVIWQFGPNLEPTNVWFGRTAIHSCHELYYELAQRIIDNTCTKEEKNQLQDLEQLRMELNGLTKVARKLRRDRLRQGALELESTEVRFELNNAKDPTKIIRKKEQVIRSLYIY
jgi:exoribonuclease R